MMVEGWVPLVSAFASGVVVRIVDHLYLKAERRFDDAVAIRHELREETRLLQTQLKALQQELDTWKERYYELGNRYHILLSECQRLRDEVQEMREHDDLRAYQQFRQALMELRAETPVPEMPKD